MGFAKDQKIKEYTLVEQIGYGASGEVWKATGNNKTVAIKFMNENLTRGPNAQKHRERMQREIDSLKSLQHPNIPRFYESDLNFTPPYLVMEYVGGKSYDKLIQTGELLKKDLKERLGIIQDLAFALHEAHEAGIIHRDIKPGNIAGGDTPRLLDFSVAIEATDIGSTALAIGTEAYMDPDPTSVADILSDIYSFAVVCFEILFGHHPVFTNEDAEERRRFSTSLGWERVTKGEWQHPSLLLKEGKLPPEFADANLNQLDAVFTKGLGPRKQRYTDVTVFARELISAALPPEKAASLWHKPNVPNIPITPEPPKSEPVLETRNDPLATEVELDKPSSKVAPLPTNVVPAQTPAFSPEKLQSWWKTLSADIQKWYKIWLLPHVNDWRRQFMTLPKNTRITALAGGAVVLGLLIVFVLIGLLGTNTTNTTDATTITSTATSVAVVITTQPTNVEPTVISTTQPTANEATAISTTQSIAVQGTVTSSIKPTDNPTTVGEVEECTKEILQAKIDAAPKDMKQNSDWKPYSCMYRKIEMVLVPPGTFMFGSRPDTDYSTPLEGQKVVMGAYLIAKYETSNELYNEYDKSRSSDSNLLNYPVEQINWVKAQGFCTENDMRLPTEVQWEYAARGPSNSLFPWGNSIPQWNSNGGYANYCDILCRGQLSNPTDASFTSLKPLFVNALKHQSDLERYDNFLSSAPIDHYTRGASWVGALNMAGNVSEWTATILQDFDPDYPYDPFNFNMKKRDVFSNKYDSARIIRGGSYIALLTDPRTNITNRSSAPELLESITTDWRQTAAEDSDQTGFYRIGVRCAMNISDFGA